MKNDDMLERFDVQSISAQLDAEAFAVLPGFFDADEARAMATLLDAGRVTLGPDGGEFTYFDNAMPPQIMARRDALYRWLAPLANRWNLLSGIDRVFPAELDAFLETNRSAGQHRQQSHLCRLREGDRLGLHRHDEGEWIFPFQVVGLLSDPKRDFTGGEFVMTEQRPRMQSRPMVVPLQCGDMAIIASAQRPIQGAHGYYRGQIKHAISRVRSGERVGLEWIFHLTP
ncbi:2OG-Fe(II) oxygenase [Burkholderia sp. Ax-1719]|uniref:2OG-Fe(II) oxygenase n=1 Tax=Burkholderia sp. Ax-1719 TaxID=2608334 RepID=UPI00141FB795|nr:2OG-Fe(II) oxygenase [Burkholderia sp. Ax-1719]NIE66320.1 2OG-Fe(II) oxygenase [Burkholderia sp. Ax-1719]